MKHMFSNTLLFVLIFISCSNKASEIKNTVTAIDSTIVGGSCEGCEAIYESPVAFEQLRWTDTLPDYSDAGTKLLITGTVYKPDGKTPAPNVVLYIYHTDQTGHYATKLNETGWGKRHGYIRGWIRTNEQGQYRFYTLKPVAYPNDNIPAHIHATLKEPGFNAYWIDEYLFDDDTLLTNAERKKCENRGGNGIILLKNKNNIMIAERDIILGANIPGYPKEG